MLIHTLKKALMQGSVSLTRHRIDLIRSGPKTSVGPPSRVVKSLRIERFS